MNSRTSGENVPVCRQVVGVEVVLPLAVEPDADLEVSVGTEGALGDVGLVVGNRDVTVEGREVAAGFRLVALVVLGNDGAEVGVAVVEVVEVRRMRTLLDVLC